MNTAQSDSDKHTRDGNVTIGNTVSQVNSVIVEAQFVYECVTCCVFML